MDYTRRVSEQMYPLTGIHPVSEAANTYTTAWVSLQNYHRALILLNVGAIGGGGTVDLHLHQAQDAAGTGSKNIGAWPGKRITQLTQAGGDGNEWVGIELSTEDLDVTNGFSFIQCRLVVGNAAALLSLTVLGVVSRFEPVPTTNWAEIVD